MRSQVLFEATNTQEGIEKQVDKVIIVNQEFIANNMIEPHRVSLGIEDMQVGETFCINFIDINYKRYFRIAEKQSGRFYVEEF